MGLQRVGHNLVTKTKTARPSLRMKAVLLKSPGNVQNTDQAKSSSMNADRGMASITYPNESALLFPWEHEKNSSQGT